MKIDNWGNDDDKRSTVIAVVVFILFMAVCLVGSMLFGNELLPSRTVTTDTCDVVEVNHVYSDTGTHAISQVIWWSWNKDFDRYDVVDWRMLADVGMPFRVSGEYVCDWLDKKCRCNFRVTAAIRRETFTLNDPEVAAREVWPEARRRKLSRGNR